MVILPIATALITNIGAPSPRTVSTSPTTITVTISPKIFDYVEKIVSQDKLLRHIWIDYHVKQIVVTD